MKTVGLLINGKVAQTKAQTANKKAKQAPTAKKSKETNRAEVERDA